MPTKSIINIDLDKLHNKDTQQFSVMYKYFLRFVIATAYFILGNIEDARDIAQEVFLKLWKSGLPKFSTEDELRGYLYIATYHQALNHVRNKRNKNEALEKYQTEKRTTPTELQPIFVENLVLEQVLKILCKNLKETDQKILKYWIQGFTNEEIAEMISKSPGTVANRKTKLKEYFKKFPPGVFD